MKHTESETVELKSVFVDEIKKEAVAFANSFGGKIYIGISDDGTVVGVENADETIQRMSNAIRDAVKPDMTMFVRYDTMIEDGKTVVTAEIQRGTNRPYYIASKGLRPEGVYVRQGTSSVPASDTAIRKMIKETDGDNYEDMRSLEQKLTFDRANEEFAKRGIEFGVPQMKTLGILASGGQYTNLGLLLSDQCPHIIKAATFAGCDQQDFQNRYEFTGSILKQLDDAYRFLDMNNQTKATFDGLLRIDHRSYPESAVREALLNAVVHRDYSVSASTLISVYEDRFEIVSFGGLVSGLTLDDIMLGLSVCRNKKLAEVFYRLQLIEAYGTGMKKIVGAYSDSECAPDIKATFGAFKLSLPNLNVCISRENEVVWDAEIKEVLDILNTAPYITRVTLEKELGIGRSSASRLLRKMVEDGILVAEGNARSIRYIKK